MSDDNLPMIPSDVVIPQPSDVVNGDSPNDLAMRQLPYWNGLMKACHFSLTQVTSMKGLTTVIDNSVKVLKVQRSLLGHSNGPRVVSAQGHSISHIPD